MDDKLKGLIEQIKNITIKYKRSNKGRFNDFTQGTVQSILEMADALLQDKIYLRELGRRWPKNPRESLLQLLGGNFGGLVWDLFKKYQIISLQRQNELYELNGAFLETAGDFLQNRDPQETCILYIRAEMYYNYYCLSDPERLTQKKKITDQKIIGYLRKEE